MADREATAEVRCPVCGAEGVEEGAPVYCAGTRAEPHSRQPMRPLGHREALIAKVTDAIAYNPDFGEQAQVAVDICLSGAGEQPGLGDLQLTAEDHRELLGVVQQELGATDEDSMWFDPDDFARLKALEAKLRRLASRENPGEGAEDG